jgi:hypothetical protein
LCVYDSDAFGGVVTEEKLRKELKTLSNEFGGNGSALTVWDKFITHCQHIMEMDATSLDHLARSMTNALCHSIPQEDHDRMHRKVCKPTQTMLSYTVFTVPFSIGIEITPIRHPST